MRSCYFLLVYVDDLILIGSDDLLAQSFVDQLGFWFSIKDLGPLSYFLGIEVTLYSRGLHLT